MSSAPRRTYAPRGQPLVLPMNTEVKRRWYLASAVSSEGDLHYVVRDQPFDAAAIVEFLRSLLRATHRKLLLIWDNASIHDCATTREFLAHDPQAPRLHLAKQPTSSPHLNADEQVWQQLKQHGLSNTCYHNLKELGQKVTEEMEQLKANRALIQRFFHHPDLGFYN